MSGPFAFSAFLYLCAVGAIFIAAGIIDWVMS